MTQTLVIGGISAADVTTNVNATFDGILTAATTGNLALTKAGLGRQILTGASRYTGATTISSGSLIVNGSLANTAVTVAGGATLGGTGFIGNTLGGSVTVTGGAAAASRGVIDLTTNTAIGTLSLSTSGTGNALTLGGTAGNAAVLNFDIANTTTDRIDILGSARLLVSAGGAIINLTQLAGTPLAAGIYPLITFSSATNTGSFTVGTGFLGGWTLNQSSSALQLVTGGAALNFSETILEDLLHCREKG